MAMGLSQITFSNFTVYTFDSLIMILTIFVDYFFSLLRKINIFCKDFMYATKTKNQF